MKFDRLKNESFFFCLSFIPSLISTKTNSREDKINVGDDGFGYGNFDTDIFKINDDTSNNVIDGGTTIIEGNNEVVNEDITSGQGRGEVATDVSIVKSSNSPVSAVAIAEGNSLNHLTI